MTRRMNPERDFTLDHYLAILRTIRSTHRVLSFKDANRLGRDILSIDKFVLLRHDVEFSLSRALAIAEADHSLGLHSTFFLLLSSDYNIFEDSSAGIIRRIIDLGHDIGLHYDAALYERLQVDPVVMATTQIRMIETYWKTKVYAMSSHMPMRSGKTFSIPGVVDVYDPLYMSDIKYISDSTQVWREGVASRVAETHDKLHLLMHEYYWSEEGYDWDVLLFLEAKAKLDEYWERAVANVALFNEGLRLREEKDKKFQERFRVPTHDNTVVDRERPGRLADGVTG